MWITNAIAHVFNDISMWCLDVFSETIDWIAPFNFLARPFLYLATLFVNIARWFIDFGDWLDNLWKTAAKAITESRLWQILETPIQWALKAWEWVVNATKNIWQVIEDWWTTATATVQGWIDIAITEVTGFIDEVRDIANNVRATWDEFTSTTLPNLLGWGEADSLIIARLKEWFPFYNTLTEIIDDVAEFFADPLEWIYTRIEAFVARYW